MSFRHTLVPFIWPCLKHLEIMWNSCSTLSWLASNSTASSVVDPAFWKKIKKKKWMHIVLNSHEQRHHRVHWQKERKSNARMWFVGDNCPCMLEQKQKNKQIGFVWATTNLHVMSHQTKRGLSFQLGSPWGVSLHPGRMCANRTWHQSDCR